MSPLTSVLPIANPQLAASLPLQNGMLAGPGAIPMRELQELPSSLMSQPVGAATGASSPSFDGILGRLVSEVNDKQAAAGAAVRGLMSGENVPLHQTMIAMEEASVSFQLMVEVRNKLVESYQELMRMQV